jgi:hypothetical protein
MGVVSFDLVRNRTRNGWTSDGRSGRWLFVRLPRCVARARSTVRRGSAQAGLHARSTQVTASDVVSRHVVTKKIKREDNSKIQYTADRKGNSNHFPYDATC